MSKSEKVALVTDASAGIGRATAQRLVKVGYLVFGASRPPKAIPKVENLALDVTSDASVGECVATVLRKAGVIDVLVTTMRVSR